MLNKDAVIPYIHKEQKESELYTLIFIIVGALIIIGFLIYYFRSSNNSKKPSYKFYDSQNISNIELDDYPQDSEHDVYQKSDKEINKGDIENDNESDENKDQKEKNDE